MNPRKILIVDDDPDVAALCRLWLEDMGHSVEWAPNAREGLRLAGMHRPDVILTDVVMEGMDGWEFVRQLRGNPDFSLVPVLFMTALGSPEARLQGVKVGADAFLEKPFDQETVCAHVTAALRRAEDVRSAVERQAARAEPSVADIQGNLAKIPLATLLSVLQAERATGILTLRGEGRAKLWLRDGHPVDASLNLESKPEDTAVSVRGLEAALELFSWHAGSYEFRGRDVQREDVIGMTTSHLLLEAARRDDEREL